MHPDLMRDLLNQRAVERREQVGKINLARALRKAMRQRGRAEAPDSLTPPIPDYVDGTFRAAVDELPACGAGAAGRAGAARK
jgi:hypothetical protein